jgi:hypothetical protein
MSAISSVARIACRHRRLCNSNNIQRGILSLQQRQPRWTRTTATRASASFDRSAQCLAAADTWETTAAVLLLAAAAAAVTATTTTTTTESEPRRTQTKVPPNAGKVNLNRMRSLRGRGLDEKYKVEWEKVLGEGAYGSVHPARLAATGEKVRAVRRCRIGRTTRRHFWHGGKKADTDVVTLGRHSCVRILSCVVLIFVCH